MRHMQTRGGAGAPHAITFKVQKAYGVKPSTANAEDGDERVDIAHWVDLDGPRSSALRQASPLVIARHVLHQLGAFLRRPLRMLQNRYQLLEQHNQVLAMLVGACVAILGVGIITALANALSTVLFPEVIALLYCVFVLIMAISFGHRSASVAVVLSLVVYAGYFVSSVNRFLKGVEIALVLALALLIIWPHFRRTFETQHHLDGLLDLAQLVVSTPNEKDLLQILLTRMLALVGPLDVLSLAVIAPDSLEKLTALAVASEGGRDALPLVLKTRRQLNEAQSALKYNKVTRHMLEARRGDRRDRRAAPGTYYVPLLRRDQVVGLIAVRGHGKIDQVASALYYAPPDLSTGSLASSREDEPLVMLRAYASHIAATLDRMKWQQQAINVEALQKSDRLKNALLASVQHDLITPVAALKIGIDNLVKEAESSRDATHQKQAGSHQSLGYLQSEVERLARLTDNCLNLVKLDEGAALPNKVWYPFAEIIGAVMTRLEKANKLAVHRIILPGNEELPSVLLDPDQIENVLINLLENAIAYSPPNTTIEVSADVLAKPPRLQISVSDEGPGIPQQAHDQIFGKFYKVNRIPFGGTRDQHKGAGLGLAICASIIRLHEGEINFDRTQAHGATFWFTLPISEEPPPQLLPED